MSTQELIEHYKNIVVQIATKDGIGTGFILADYDIIVTNYHVVKGNWGVTIKGAHLEKQLADVVYINPKLDLAFIRTQVELTDIEDVLPQEDLLKDGDTVIAIGHPFGLNYSATQGVVSRADRIRDGLRYVQTDTAINPGNSGGPLINLQGKIIGVNTFIIQDANNIGFALSVGYVKQAFEEYEAYPYFGYPTTACGVCNTLVSHHDVDMEKYCPNCGSQVELMELSGIQEEEAQSYEGGNIVQTIERGLDEIGCSSQLSANGQNRWSVVFQKANVEILYKPENRAVYFDSCQGRVPKENIKAIYEYMLRTNYNLQRYFFFTSEENLYFSCIILDMDMPSTEFSELLMDFGYYADLYFVTMQSHFKCLPPVYEDR